MNNRREVSFESSRERKHRPGILTHLRRRALEAVTPLIPANGLTRQRWNTNRDDTAGAPRSTRPATGWAVYPPASISFANINSPQWP